jgi:hypothetical protein
MQVTNGKYVKKLPIKGKNEKTEKEKEFLA